MTIPRESQTTTAVETSAEDRLAWLALALAPGMGPRRVLDAMRRLEAPSQLFTLTLTELEGLRMPAEAAQHVFDGKARQAAEAETARVAEQQARILTFECAE